MDKDRVRQALPVLLHAKEKLARPAGWTQYAFARLADGRQVVATHPDAVCYCVSGAIHSRGGNDTWIAAEFANETLNVAIFDRMESLGITSENNQRFARDGLMSWNDTKGRTQEQAQYLVNLAIKRAEQLLEKEAA